MTEPSRPIYVITVQARHGDGIRSLRALLKRLLRGSALKCLTISESHNHKFARHSASSSPAASFSRSRNRATAEDKMRKTEAYPSKYFRASDHENGWALTAEIEMARMEKFENGNSPVEKLVVYFRRQRSGLVVGSVVWDQLVAATGEDDSDNWKGKVVELFKTTTPFGSKIVDCIRVRKAEVSTKKPAPKKVTVDADSEEVAF